MNESKFLACITSSSRSSSIPGLITTRLDVFDSGNQGVLNPTHVHDCKIAKDHEIVPYTFKINYLFEHSCNVCKFWAKLMNYFLNYFRDLIRLARVIDFRIGYSCLSIDTKYLMITEF
jgi:hypothetical protein